MSPGGAPKTAKKAMRWLEKKVVYSMGFGVVFLLAVGAVLFYFYETTEPAPNLVRIAYGAGAPVRKRFLEQMVLHGKKHNLDIRLVATDGTDHTLTQVDQGVADLGLVAGVIEDRGARKILEVMPLYMEPLQLLVREGLYEAVLGDFAQLRGKTIDLDAEGSSTNLLATELLRFMGMTDSATGRPLYQPVHIPQMRLVEKREGPVPDAIFQIGGVPSATIRSLIARYGYRIVPLPFGESFNLDKFREAESPDEHSNLRLNKSFVEQAVVPAYVYSVLPPVPPVDTHTIATRLVLVGREGLEARVVSQVLELILGPEVSGFPKPVLTVDLLNTSFQFERHPGTDLYLNSLKPVDVDSAFVAYGRMVEVWGIIITLYIAASRGLKAWRQRKVPDERKSVGEFMLEVLAVEAQAGASTTAADRLSLDQRLSEIKKESIELHLDDRLENAEELPSLLTTLADTRTRIWGRPS